MPVISRQKFAVFPPSGYASRYLGDGGTDRREILHDGRYGPRTGLLRFGAAPPGIPQIRNFGPQFWPFDREYLENGISRSVTRYDKHS